MSQLKYIDKFLSLKCAADIIGISYPIKQFTKEISEAMAMITHIKSKMLKSPMEYVLIDLCSGNALVPLISAFMLPSKWNYAIDIRERNRSWYKAKRFNYKNKNIFEKEFLDFINRTANEGPVILSACHPCKNLAERCIELYNNSQAETLIMMPCCVGKMSHKISDNIAKQIGQDNLWNMHLAKKANGRLKQDNNVISPKNRIIIANKNAD